MQPRALYFVSTDFFFGLLVSYRPLAHLENEATKQETGSIVDPSWGAIPAYDRWTELLGSVMKIVTDKHHCSLLAPPSTLNFVTTQCKMFGRDAPGKKPCRKSTR